MVLVVRWIDGDYADAFFGRVLEALDNQRLGLAAYGTCLPSNALPRGKQGAAGGDAEKNADLPTVFGTSYTPSECARPASTPREAVIYSDFVAILRYEQKKFPHILIRMLRRYFVFAPCLP